MFILFMVTENISVVYLKNQLQDKLFYIVNFEYIVFLFENMFAELYLSRA